MAVRFELNHFSDFYYTYNDSGMITKIEAYQKYSPSGGLVHRTRNYTYDDVYRLKSEQ